MPILMEIARQLGVRRKIDNEQIIKQAEILSDNNKCSREKSDAGKDRGWQRVEKGDLDRITRKSLTEKMAFEQRAAGSEGRTQVTI